MEIYAHVSFRFLVSCNLRFSCEEGRPLLRRSGLAGEHPRHGLYVPQVRSAGAVKPRRQLVPAVLPGLGAAVGHHGKEDLLLAAVGEPLLSEEVAELVQRPGGEVLWAEEGQGGGEPAKVVQAEAVQKGVQDLHVEQAGHLPEVQESLLLRL